MCSEIPIISKGCLIAVENFVNLQNVWIVKQICKRWVFVYIVFIEIVSVMSLGSIEVEWSEPLNSISMELHFVKDDLRFLSGKMFLTLEKQKLLNQNL